MSQRRENRVWIRISGIPAGIDKEEKTSLISAVSAATFIPGLLRRVEANSMISGAAMQVVVENFPIAMSSLRENFLMKACKAVQDVFPEWEVSGRSILAKQERVTFELESR